MLYSCNTKSAPLRSEGRHSSEMISEILFGEYLTATGNENEYWMEVQCEWDDYEGWISKGQVEKVTGFEQNAIWGLAAPEQYYPASNKRNEYSARFDLELFKNKYLGVPYYWGGRSTSGIDCSGLSQVFFKLQAIRIPRDASMQALCGEEVSDLEHVVFGDLAFFANKNGNINHVGILLDHQHIMHSTETQGRVVIDRIDADGIINSQTGQHSHPLTKMVRIYERD